MKVLWITNLIFPEAESLLTGNGELKSSGGWMLAAASAITKNDRIELTVATPAKMVRRLQFLKGKDINYYLFPETSKGRCYDKRYEKYWLKIKQELQPDVVHIWGTEYSHGLAYVRTCGADNVLVDIQGMTSVYYDYYFGGLSNIDILSNITCRDLIKGTLFKAKRQFFKSGELEKEQISRVHFFTGRTTWDHAHVKAINLEAQYFPCARILRNDFYEGKWDYSRCTPSTIFLSQSATPLKGLHQVLKAMPIILREYPDLQIRIPGYNLAAAESFTSKMKRTGYGKYIGKLIAKYNIGSHIKFLGPLNAAQMRDEYLKANLFLCPSAIENSPNSLAEAQILGVPCLASFVGGVNDMIPTPNCGNIYRYDDVETLAFEVCTLLSTSKTFDNTEVRNMAQKRHDKNTIAAQYEFIYNTIIAKERSSQK